MKRSWIAVAAAMFCCGWGGNQFTPLLVMYRETAGYSVLTVDEFLGAYVVGLALSLSGGIGPSRATYSAITLGVEAGWFGW